MRVLYWTERFWPHIGGVEILSMQLIPALQKLGYEFKMVTSHSDLDLPDEEVYNEISISRFHFLTSLTHKDLKQMLTVRKQLVNLKQTFQPDLFHIHFSGPSPLFHWQTSQAHAAPTLMTIHSLPSQRKQDQSLLVKTLRQADWINTVSSTMLSDLRELVPEIVPRSSVIYNGLQMPDTPPKPLSFKEPRLLCLGRLVKWKGFDLAIAAFALLTKRFPTARLVIAGDGPAKTDLERQAQELGIQDGVEFTGWIEPEKVPDLMNTATLVLILSRTEETLPVVALQAAQMARPVVATEMSGLPEIVIHQQTGVLVEPDNSTELAGAIADLFLDPERTTEMGQAARSQAQKRFGMNSWVNAYDAVYQKLITSFTYDEKH